MNTRTVSMTFFILFPQAIRTANYVEVTIYSTYRKLSGVTGEFIVNRYAYFWKTLQ
jgi:hypothetical protein